MHCFQWDWKSEPDWAKINKALEGWQGSVIFTPVDTDSDSMGVVLSHAKLTKREATVVFNNWIEKYE